MRLTLSDHSSPADCRLDSLHTSSDWLYRPRSINTEAVRWSFEWARWRLAYSLLSAASMCLMDSVCWRQVSQPISWWFCLTVGHHIIECFLATGQRICMPSTEHVRGTENAREGKERLESWVIRSCTTYCTVWSLDVQNCAFQKVITFTVWKPFLIIFISFKNQ